MHNRILYFFICIIPIVLHGQSLSNKGKSQILDYIAQRNIQNLGKELVLMDIAPSLQLPTIAKGNTTQGTSNAEKKLFFIMNAVLDTMRIRRSTDGKGSAHFISSLTENKRSHIQYSNTTKNRGHVFYTNNGTSTEERMRINGNGFIGIGTNDPRFKLDVFGDIHTETGKIHLKHGTIIGNQPSGLIYQSDDPNVARFALTDSNNKHYASFIGNRNGLQFGLLDGDGNWSYLALKDTYTQFRINNKVILSLHSNGSVGIGTRQPYEKLDVIGNVRITQGLFAEGDYSITKNPPSVRFDFTGWKIGMYGSRYWQGVATRTMSFKTEEWIGFFGSSNPANDANQNLVDSNAAIAVNAEQQNIQFKTRENKIKTPRLGYGGIYAKTDGKVYFQNDEGIEYDLTSPPGWDKMIQTTEINNCGSLLSTGKIIRASNIDQAYYSLPSLLNGNGSSQDLINVFGLNISQPDAWIEIDLGQNYYLEDITLFSDFNGRNSNFYLFISTNPFDNNNVNNIKQQEGVTTYYREGGMLSAHQIQAQTEGRYIRIQQSIPGNQFFQNQFFLSEIEIHGCLDTKDDQLFKKEDTLKKIPSLSKTENTEIIYRMNQLQNQIDKLKAATRSKNKDIFVSLNNDNFTDNPSLYQNVPNPVAHSTSIQYYIPAKTRKASLLFYTIKGQLIKEIPLTETGKGRIVVDPKNLRSGNYLYSLIVDGEPIGSKTMIVVN